MSSPHDAPMPYGSAYDLPSITDMMSQLRAGKVLTMFIARDQRAKLAELEADLLALCELVDRFYEVLGDRHWIFTESLSLDGVREFMASASSADDAEAGVIRVISDRISGAHWRTGLLGHEALRARSAALDRARAHYLQEEWASCALTLVTVMDGFVNDAEPSERRGLHARTADEMAAWDSVVGHHKGLTAVMPEFLRTFKRRHDEEVFEVHRHGMVHGTVTNYDNQVVAAKAWNMLAAVADWAKAKERSLAPKAPKPSLKATLIQLADHARFRRYSDEFVPWELTKDDPGFARQDVVKQAQQFLSAWQRAQWGLVAQSLPRSLLGSDSSPGKDASLAKSFYQATPLEAYTMTRVSFPRPLVAVVHGLATFGSHSGPMAIRWMWEPSNGQHVGVPDGNGRWTVAVVPPTSFISATSTED